MFFSKTKRKKKHLFNPATLIPSVPLLPPPPLGPSSLTQLGDEFLNRQGLIFVPGRPSTDDCSALLQLLVDGHFSLPGNRFPQCSCQSTGQIASCHRKQQLFKATLWNLRSPNRHRQGIFFFLRPAALDSSQREAKGL